MSAASPLQAHPLLNSIRQAQGAHQQSCWAGQARAWRALSPASPPSAPLDRSSRVICGWHDAAVCVGAPWRQAKQESGGAGRFCPGRPLAAGAHAAAFIAAL